MYGSSAAHSLVDNERNRTVSQLSIPPKHYKRFVGALTVDKLVKLYANKRWWQNGAHIVGPANIYLVPLLIARCPPPAPAIIIIVRACIGRRPTKTHRRHNKPFHDEMHCHHTKFNYLQMRSTQPPTASLNIFICADAQCIRIDLYSLCVCVSSGHALSSSIHLTK